MGDAEGVAECVEDALGGPATAPAHPKRRVNDPQRNVNNSNGNISNSKVAKLEKLEKRACKGHRTAVAGFQKERNTKRRGFPPGCTTRAWCSCGGYAHHSGAHHVSHQSYLL